MSSAPNVVHLICFSIGSGEVDYGVLKLLPGIISYTAVEPDEDVLSTLRSRLAEVPAQQVKSIFMIQHQPYFLEVEKETCKEKNEKSKYIQICYLRYI